MAVAYFAAVDRFRNLVVTDGGNIISDNGNFSTDGAGNLTATSIIAAINASSGNVNAGTLQLVETTNTAQVITTGGTITVPANTSVVRVNPGAAVTGIILPTSTINGQILIVINIAVAANTVTFATAATSHVADGTAAVITGPAMKVFVWDTTEGFWYHS
jgi:hypothetical protein